MTRPVVRLPEHLRQEMIEHCVNELPNEGCGLFAVAGAQIVKVYPTGNLQSSPYGYTVPPEAHITALTDAESRGWALGGVFHSHPQGTAEPSSVDVSSALEPEWIYLVLALLGDPELRAWSIRDGSTTEVEVSLT